jgi:hypothetical protein
MNMLLLKKQKMWIQMMQMFLMMTALINCSLLMQATWQSIRKREYKIIMMLAKMLVRIIKLKVLDTKQLIYLLTTIYI